MEASLASMASNSFNQQTKIPNYARSKIRIVDEQEEAMKAIVTTLPGADLKFLKKRRSAEMRKKVAVSYYQERLMRYIYMHIYVHICMHTYVCTYVYTCICIYICIQYICL
jgi:acyl-CoA hydrolase